MAAQSNPDSVYDYDAAGKRDPEDQETLYIRLISGLLIVLGAGAIIAFLTTVFTNPELAELGSDDTVGAGAYVLSFLDSFGLIIPALVIGFGAYFINLGIKMNTRDYLTAAWSEFVLFWLGILLLLGAAWQLYQSVVRTLGIREETAGEPPPFFSTWMAEIPWLLIILELVVVVLALIAWKWLGNNKEELFKGGDTLSTRDARLAWTLLLPTLAILILVAARPLERTFIASLTDERLAGVERVEFVGLENYIELLSFRFDTIGCETDDAGACAIDDDGEVDFPIPRAAIGDSYRGFNSVYEVNVGETQYVFSARDADFFESLQNTLFYTVVAVSLEFALGMVVALVVNAKFPGRGIMRAAMLVPWAIPTVVSARLWEVMLRDNRSGVVNDMLIRTGIINDPVAWLANSDTQIWSLIFVDVWKTTPFFALLLLAGLQTIPGDVYEAAQVDGASRIRRFFSITLPLLRPTIAVALIFRTLDSLRAFDVFDVLVGRQLQSMSTYTQQQLVQSQEFGYASAVGVFIFLIILAFTVVYVRIFGIDTQEAN